MGCFSVLARKSLPMVSTSFLHITHDYHEISAEIAIKYNEIAADLVTRYRSSLRFQIAVLPKWASLKFQRNQRDIPENQRDVVIIEGKRIRIFQEKGR